MFYDYELFTSNFVETKKNNGQIIKIYSKNLSFKGDLQQITEYEKKEIWGNAIEANYTLYTNQTLYVGDIIFYKEKSFKVKKKISWDYFCYALEKETCINTNTSYIDLSDNEGFILSDNEKFVLQAKVRKEENRWQINN